MQEYYNRLQCNEHRLNDLLTTMDIKDMSLPVNRITELELGICWVNPGTGSHLKDQVMKIKNALKAGQLPKLELLYISVVKQGHEEDIPREEMNKIVDLEDVYLPMACKERNIKLIFLMDVEWVADSEDEEYENSLEE